MNNKKRASLKTLILLPVFILGALTIICNVMAINNIRTVNSNAADITDNCMMSVSDLGEIKNDIQVIHTLGLSHIIATDLNTMISVVGEIPAPGGRPRGCARPRSGTRRASRWA